MSVILWPTKFSTFQPDSREFLTLRCRANHGTILESPTTPERSLDRKRTRFDSQRERRLMAIRLLASQFGIAAVLRSSWLENRNSETRRVEVVMRKRLSVGIALVADLAVITAMNVGATHEGIPQSEPLVQASSATVVPEWMAWKAFQDSLRFYARQSSAAVNNMLTANFGLSNTECRALLVSGELFVSAFDRIDADARAELQARYRPIAPRNPRHHLPAFPPGTIVLPPGKTLRDLAVETGLYERVEQLKQELLTRHVEELKREIGSVKVNSIRDWVETNIRPKINISDTPPQDFGGRTPNGAPSRDNRSDIRER
jgi:hypothetical protein